MTTPPQTPHIDCICALGDSRFILYMFKYFQNKIFKAYYKVRQNLLQAYYSLFYYKGRQLALQSATAILLHSAASVITKYDRYYNESAIGITKCDRINGFDAPTVLRMLRAS